MAFIPDLVQLRWLFSTGIVVGADKDGIGCRVRRLAVGEYEILLDHSVENTLAVAPLFLSVPQSIITTLSVPGMPNSIFISTFNLSTGVPVLADVGWSITAAIIISQG